VLSNAIKDIVVALHYERGHLLHDQGGKQRLGKVEDIALPVLAGERRAVTLTPSRRALDASGVGCPGVCPRRRLNTIVFYTKISNSEVRHDFHNDVCTITGITYTSTPKPVISNPQARCD
jgi:hypothetical protein